MPPIDSNRRRRTLGLLLAAGAAGAAGVAMPALAQPAFPEAGKTLRILVPYTPGGSSDFIARTVASRLGDVLSHPVVVENRPGGNTVIATDLVAKSPPDGYNLVLLGELTYASVASLSRQLPFDPDKDIAPIGNAIESPLVIVVNPSVPAKTLKEFVSWVKTRPGEVAFGSAGIGNTLHLAGESFAATIGTKMNHIPYKGASQAVVDLIGGNIQLMIDLPQTPLPNIQSGKLRALAVTSAERLAVLPDVPTTAEAGLPDYRFTTRVGFATTGGTPKPILDQLHAAIGKVLAMPDVQSAFAGQAMFVRPSTSPDDFRRSVTEQRDRIGKLLKNAGIEPQ